MSNMNLLGVASAAALSLAAIFGPGQASAASVTITSTAPTWNNVVGGTGVNTDTSGGGNNTVFQVFWGNPAGGDGQSGLGFNPSNPPSATVNTDTVFQLGTLTHYNEPISGGTAASSAQLNLATTITGATPTTQMFSYQFLIDETPNTAPCAYPSNTPCADRITFANLTTTSAFTIGGVPYTIELLGFSSNGGTTISSHFDSQEGGTNNIGLYARIVAPFTTVPEPASLALLGAGLLGFAAARRRRQN